MKMSNKALRAMAELACFYVTPGGTWLRMHSVADDEDAFYALDEDSGEEYKVMFDEMEDEPHFERLVRMSVDVFSLETDET